jgi:uncharacterized membrane protein (UPF0127 family)
MKLLAACSLAVVMVLSGLAFAEDLATVQLSIKGQQLVAETAATTATRTVGLMHRFSLKPDHGMLFVFNAPQPLAFWMKHTFVPLSIAFIGADGRILNIEDMTPQTETPHPSRGLALYALEMKKGWFAERAIAAGDRVEGLEKAPTARQ